MPAGMDAPVEVQQPGDIIALARARRAFELGRLSGWGTTLTPSLWQRLREREDGVSSGTLVALLRHAMRQRQTTVTKEVFLLLLERTETPNAFWARHVVAGIRAIGGLPPETAQMMREDLRQELTLHLWEELALREREGWELFFRRSLVFARAHVARRYLERHGYRPGQRLVLFFADIAAWTARSASDGDGVPDEPPPVALYDPLAASDLADLRGYVEQLPPRERAAVVMRYWQQARDHEIADALGVTPRTVRNLLHRAHVRLYALYSGEEKSETESESTSALLGVPSMPTEGGEQ